MTKANEMQHESNSTSEVTAPQSPVSRPGDRIRYTMDNLGLIGRRETVKTGDLGTVIGPGPDEGWIYTEPDAYPRTVCPVSAGMIEPADA